MALELPHDVRLFVKREDRIHPVISGNKYRKLRYNLGEARLRKHSRLLTFGGAFSNHIAAVAATGFFTVGIIRGEEDSAFDFICCAVGTGGTLCGLVNSAFDCQYVLGFSAVKGDFLQDDIRRFVHRENRKLINNYHFGGFGKVNAGLIAF